jgi:hypothetical protein
MSPQRDPLAGRRARNTRCGTVEPSVPNFLIWYRVASCRTIWSATISPHPDGIDPENGT